MNTHVLELRIVKLYIPESVVVSAVVPSSVVAAAVVSPSVVPFNNIRSSDVRVRNNNDTNNSHNNDNNTCVWEIGNIKVYIPEAVVGTAVLPSSVVVAAVVSPEGVPYNNNRSIDVSGNINIKTQMY